MSVADFFLIQIPVVLLIFLDKKSLEVSPTNFRRILAKDFSHPAALRFQFR